VSVSCYLPESRANSRQIMVRYDQLERREETNLYLRSSIMFPGLVSALLRFPRRVSHRGSIILLMIVLMEASMKATQYLLR